MAGYISERQVAKLCLFMQQRFSPIIQFAEQQAEQIQPVERREVAQQLLDYIRAEQEEMVDVMRELAKDEPDKAKILAWISKYGGDFDDITESEPEEHE